MDRNNHAGVAQTILDTKGIRIACDASDGNWLANTLDRCCRAKINIDRRRLWRISGSEHVARPEQGGSKAGPQDQIANGKEMRFAHRNPLVARAEDTGQRR